MTEKEEIEKLNQQITVLMYELAESKKTIGVLQNENNRIISANMDSENELRKSVVEYHRLQKVLVDEINNLKSGLYPQTMTPTTHSRPATAIVIITYNNANLITRQVDLLRRLCMDPIDIIIVDNSTDDDVIKAIKYYNDTNLHCIYLKTTANSKNGSESHSFAANLSYLKFQNDYEYFMYIDHDCFPVKPFSIKGMLDGKIMAGMGQNKDGIEYFWPGCVMWDNWKITHSLVNFSPSHELKLDTGGMLYKVVGEYGRDLCMFLNERYEQNLNFNKSMYNFYVMINDGMFMHFINSSGWNPTDGHEERMNSLLNILEEKVKEPNIAN